MAYFLDTEKHWFIADTRHELVDALLAHLDPETVDLPDLAAACLGGDTSRCHHRRKLTSFFFVSCAQVEVDMPVKRHRRIFSL